MQLATRNGVDLCMLQCQRLQYVFTCIRYDLIYPLNPVFYTVSKYYVYKLRISLNYKTFNLQLLHIEHICSKSIS